MAPSTAQPEAGERGRHGAAARWLPGLFLVSGLLVVLGCPRASPSAAADPSAAAPKPTPPAEVGGCRAWLGRPSDVDLRGLTRTHPVRCCPSRYGLEPERVVEACGLEAYLGESEELACVHRFRANDGSVHELRVVAALGQPFAAAVDLLARSELGPDRVDDRPGDGLWWSEAGGRRWALIDGWPEVRRLSWDVATCAPSRMLPVLAAMAAAPADPAAGVALPRLDSDDAGPPEPAPAGPSLLDGHPAPDDAATRGAPTIGAPTLGAPTIGAPMLGAPTLPAAPLRPLPRSAEPLAAALVEAAATRDRAGFAALLTADARLGLPDRRELGARSIADDLGVDAAIDAVRAAFARLPAETPLRCPAVDRRVRPAIARGEALMWCFWIAPDGLDLVTLGLRGHLVDGRADGRIAYVGLFPARPIAPLIVPGEPPPPPLVPVPRLDCRDPHARSYPDVCPPEPEPEPEPELLTPGEDG